MMGRPEAVNEWRLTQTHSHTHTVFTFHHTIIPSSFRKMLSVDSPQLWVACQQPNEV